MISTVSVIGSLSPVTTVVLGAVRLRERPGWLPGTGVVGVLVGVGLVTAFGGAYNGSRAGFTTSPGGSIGGWGCRPRACRRVAATGGEEERAPPRAPGRVLGRGAPALISRRLSSSSA
jgi:hypothetical protein